MTCIFLSNSDHPVQLYATANRIVPGRDFSRSSSESDQPVAEAEACGLCNSLEMRGAAIIRKRQAKAVQAL
jgi:hypothetical protein